MITRNRHDARFFPAPQRIALGSHERTTSAASHYGQSYRGRLPSGKWLLLNLRNRLALTSRFRHQPDHEAPRSDAPRRNGVSATPPYHEGKPSFRRSASKRCFCHSALPRRKALVPTLRVETVFLPLRPTTKESPRSDAPRRNGVCAAPRRACRESAEVVSDPFLSVPSVSVPVVVRAARTAAAPRSFQ